MSAVLKEQEQAQASDLAVIEPKSLSEILVISDQLPDDFYKNTAKYQAQLDVAIESAKSLVHEINDEGRKLAKADVAIIRKYAKTTNGFSLSVFRSLTDKVKLWKDEITGKTKVLETEADNIMARFEALEKEKLDSIFKLLVDELAGLRTELGVKAEFQETVDLSPMVKLTGTVTDKGKLTTKASAFIKSLADGELAQQNKIEARIMVLENKCLRADINPPLSVVHLGNALYAEDEVFNSKVDELINAEIDRRAEMEARIIKQQEAANQKRLDDALKAQQQEADRLAKEKAAKDANSVALECAEITKKAVDEINSKSKPQAPEELREIAKQIEISAQYADRNTDRDKELKGAAALRRQADDLEKQQVQPTPETRTVVISVNFEFTGITRRTSNAAVEKFFIDKMPVFEPKMQEKFIGVSSRDA